MKKLFLLRFSVAAFFCMLCVLSSLAANIKVKGAVKDKLSKEPLIGATIRLIGTQAGAVTDMDGNFELNAGGVLEGMYDIEIKYVGYKTEVRRKVRVENGKLVILNLELETDAQELADVVVVAKKNRENENMLLLEQQKAVIAVQSVGVKELSRKGVSDAEGAVTKVCEEPHGKEHAQRRLCRHGQKARGKRVVAILRPLLFRRLAQGAEAGGGNKARKRHDRAKHKDHAGRGYRCDRASHQGADHHREVGDCREHGVDA